MKFNQYIKEGISLPIIKKAIKQAVKDDPKRLGHGHTAKTSFWILSTGDIISQADWKKEWKRIIDDKDAIQFHSHSPASGKGDKGFETFSGGDIQAFRLTQSYGINQIGLISAKGQLHILKGGSWTKKDERYSDNIVDQDQTEYLKQLAKERGGKLIVTRWK